MKTKKIKLPYKLLTYDIETGLLAGWFFALGEQAVRHNQLLECCDMFSILTIAYKWYDEDKVHVIEGENCVEEFDKIARKADIIIGKNNFRFDDKRLQTERMLKGLPPFPEWMFISEDLESQLRRFFAFPSYSLDAISKHLGLGGKDKMEFNDWVSIAKLKLLLKFTSLTKDSKASKSFCITLFKTPACLVLQDGKKALKKMMIYNKKDVLDTEAILIKVLPYIKLKKNAGADSESKGCITCGSLQLIPTKIITKGQTRYQQFDCLEHTGYAGMCTVRYNKNRNKVFGKMG